MLARIGTLLLVGASYMGVAQAGMVVPGDSDGMLDAVSCDLLLIPVTHLNFNALYTVITSTIGGLQQCFVNDSSTKWVSGRLDTAFPGGNLSDINCDTTAFDICNAQLTGNTLSIFFSGIFNSPGVPGGGGEVLLTLTGWSPGEQFFGSFNNAVNAVPEPGPLETVPLCVTALVLWRRFTSRRKHTS